MSATCLVVRSVAPTADISRLSSRLDTHIASCLACQAEMARYGRLRRQLAALLDVVEAAPAPLATAVERAIAEADAPLADTTEHSHPARVAAAAGAVAAAAAGAVAVAVWRHSRPAV